MSAKPLRSKLLATRVEGRRKALGYTPTTFADATGLTPQALLRLRHGEVRDYQERLTGRVTAVLRWSPDSIDRLLQGREPIEVEVEPLTPSDTVASVDLRAEIDELRVELESLRRWKQHVEVGIEAMLEVELTARRRSACERRSAR